MNKQIEALKMAIDDLELCNGAETVENIIIYTHEAIKACKEALAEADKQEPVSLGDFDKLSKYECVEYIDYLRKEIDLLRFREWQSLSDEEIRHLKYEYADYTLYDEGDGVCPEVELEVEEFARAIEQALKDKNKF